MKTLSPALAEHLATECTTLAYLIKLTRKDNVVLGFTNHDADIVLAGVTYKADAAFQPSALLSTSKLSTDNLSVSGIISDNAITADDLAAGRYDHARCDVYVCNWTNINHGVLQLRRGWIGEVTMQNDRYSAELRGLHDLLQHEIGDYYTAECRHELGDISCGVTIASYSVTGAVTAPMDQKHFYDNNQSAPSGWLAYGTVRWLSGGNQGLAMEVKRWDAATKQYSLWLPMPNAPQIGDTYIIHAGCDKRFATCKNKFNNGLNFGGFPHIPGVDKILSYPDSKA